MLRAQGVSDTGRVRSHNEDCFAVREDLGLCVVADGMGGHNAGEVASRLAVDTIVFCCDATLSGGAVAAQRPALPKPAADDEPQTGDHRWPFGYDPAFSEAGNLLRTAIHLANLHILETASTDEGFSGMGTTVVAICVVDGRLSVAHVGDSRLYLFANGTLRQMTRDDSWVASMLALDPSADPALLQNHPMRSALTNVVGDRGLTEIHVFEQPLAGGELMLLTTDGVHGIVDDKAIQTFMSSGDDLEEIAKKLVTAALDGGSRDNCTAIVARYER